MRSDPRQFQIHRFKEWPQALKKLAESNTAPFAGGTDLMVQFEAGRLRTREFVDLWPFEAFRKIEESPAEIRVGALCTYTQIQGSKTIQNEFPILVQAARETGAVAIQNRGTLGGNIANASPAGDSLPGLLVYEARLVLARFEGGKAVERSLPYDQFHLGYKKTALKPGEVITAILLARNSIQGAHRFVKVGTRKAQAISKIALAGVIQKSKSGEIESVRVALGSMAAFPLRLKTLEKNWIGKKTGDALKCLSQLETLEPGLTPQDDVRTTREYRLQVAKNLLRDFVCE